jgi:DNA-binding CsgD family transcriptional regulator
MVDRTKNRSDSYQVFFAESPHSPEKLTEFSDAQGISGVMNSLAYSEELLDLKEQLLKAFWRIVDTQLTPRQREVLHLYAKGLTQIEIAKKLNVNQSSITKSINGNCDYKNKRRVYGGAKRKILRIANKDEEILQIFKRMAEIKEEQSL